MRFLEKIKKDNSVKQNDLPFHLHWYTDTTLCQRFHLGLKHHTEPHLANLRYNHNCLSNSRLIVVHCTNVNNNYQDLVLSSLTYQYLRFMGVETVFHALTKFNENHSGELKTKTKFINTSSLITQPNIRNLILTYRPTRSALSLIFNFMHANVSAPIDLLLKTKVKIEI